MSSNLRSEILRAAADDEDHLFVAIFDEPITDHERALEREADRMEAEGLLSETRSGQYRRTRAGWAALGAIEKPVSTQLRSWAPGKEVVWGVIGAILGAALTYALGIK